MNRDYWENLAATYDEQIFSVWRNDEAGRIRDVIAEHARPDASAADLGCGPGQVTPHLAHHFQHVHASDVSSRLLAQARQACRGLENVSFHRCDLSTGEPAPFSPVDFVVCINVLLTPDLEKRERLWTGVTSLVADGGTLLLVLPSHESALYTNYRRVDWYLRAGCNGDEALRHGLPTSGDVRRLEHGVRSLEGVATKHYLREEIIVQLADRGLTTERIERLTYSWSTEFEEPPEWLAEPFPWNWLVVAKRPAY